MAATSAGRHNFLPLGRTFWPCVPSLFTVSQDVPSDCKVNAALSRQEHPGHDSLLHSPLTLKQLTRVSDLKHPVPRVESSPVHCASMQSETGNWSRASVDFH